MIQYNFEIMKKISNLKIGRENLMKKNLVPNILKNINLAAMLRNKKAVIIGLNIIDNLTRIEGGKEALKEADVIKHLSDILNFFENNDEVLKMGSKIYSKISKPEDVIIEVNKLKSFGDVNDYSDLVELKKILVLISNFILVEDITKVLCQPENITIIKNLFLKISNIDLHNKSPEYIKNYLLLNKYFIIIFHRIFHLIPEFFENEEIEENINKSVLNNWNAICLVRQNHKQNENNNNNNVFDSTNPDSANDEIESFNNAFSEFFGSFADFFEKIYKQKDPEDHILLAIMDFFLKDQIFINDEKANNSACKIIKVANRLKNSNERIKNKILSLFDFLISTVKFSDDLETLTYALNILNEIFLDSFSKNLISSLEVNKDGNINLAHLLQNSARSSKSETQIMQDINKHFNLRDVLLKIVVDLMNKKPKYRKPVSFIFYFSKILLYFFLIFLHCCNNYKSY